MLKKRIVGVVTIKNGWAVQSIGYKRYLPLGKPECLIENLDRWGADEILVQVIDRSINSQGPDFRFLERIAKLGLETPLIYCGGIRTTDDGLSVIQGGADRLALDALLLDDSEVVRDLSHKLGAQAIIGAMPMIASGGKLNYVNYRNGQPSPLPKSCLELMEEGTVSELLMIDCTNEGSDGGFDQRLVENFPLSQIPLIVFGGISRPMHMSQLLQKRNVAAIGIGNFLNYREHAVQKFKEALGTASLRPPVYQSDYAD